jgi:hypothetical protein
MMGLITLLAVPCANMVETNDILVVPYSDVLGPVTLFVVLCTNMMGTNDTWFSLH